MSLQRKIAQLVRSLPSDNPVRRSLIALLKEAFNKETAAFVAWALTKDDKWEESKVQRTLEKITGKAAEPLGGGGGGSPKRGPLAVGETVRADAHENTNAANVDECKQYHDRVGVVQSKTNEGVTVQFYRKDTMDLEPGAVAFFDGMITGRATGLYRWTPKPEMFEGIEKKILLEVVYLRGGTRPPSQTNMEAFREYIQKGLAHGEQREEVYYSGYFNRLGFNKKDGDFYFNMLIQQRPYPVTFSPNKGKILYIGVAGHRPSGWQHEAEEWGLLSEAG
jgi:hypothetical protein